MELLKDNRIKDRFVKDYSLPIKVVRDVEYLGESLDSFNYYLSHMKEYYNTEKSLDNLKKYLNKVNCSEDFFEKTSKVISEVQKSIVEKKEFESFKNSYSMYKGDLESLDLKKNKYLLLENDGKKFISIDLKEANFQSLGFFDSNLVGGYDSYNKYIREFTDEEYILEAKRIRQVIFGDKVICPKGQQRIQRYIIGETIKSLTENGYIDKKTPMEVTSDEIIIREDYLNKNIEDFKDFLPINLEKVRYRVESFSIERLNTREKVKQNIFLKKQEDLIKIKNCPARYVPEVIAFLKAGRDINKYKDKLSFLDRLVYEEGRVYTYHDYLFC